MLNESINQREQNETEPEVKTPEKEDHEPTEDIVQNLVDASIERKIEPLNFEHKEKGVSRRASQLVEGIE